MSSDLFLETKTGRLVLHWTKSLGKAGEPLWVSGLALLQIILFSRFLPLTGESYEWAQYLLLATLYPLFLLAIERLVPLLPLSSVWLQVVKFLLAGAWPVITFTILLPVAGGQVFLILTALSVLQTILYLFVAPRVRTADRELGLADVWVLGLVGTVAWVVAARVIWWQSFIDWVWNPITLTILVACLFLVVVNLFHHRQVSITKAGKLHQWSTLGAFLVLAVVSLRVGDCGPGFYHHWGFFVGPAELVRQGGWLLWDVPAQYGFLSTLLIAFFPTSNVWQSLYVTNALLTFLSASFLFCMLRPKGSGFFNLAFSMALTLAAVFLLPGDVQNLTGPFIAPSVGAFRFCWCYVLLAILVWASRIDPTGSGYRLCLWTGCVAWLVGTLWACESAVYCSLIWLPAYGLAIWQRTVLIAGQAEIRARGRIRDIGFWLVIPPALLLTSTVLISIYYRVCLGATPDWYAFAEYPLAYANGLCSMPIDPSGGVWLLVMIWSTLAAVGVAYLQQGGVARVPPLLVGIAGAVWGVSSYFVSRSHENNITNISTILCTGLACTLYLLRNCPVSHRWCAVVKTSFVPVLTVMLAAVFANRPALAEYWTTVRKGYTRHLDRRLPTIDGSMLALLDRAQITSRGPLLIINWDTWNPACRPPTCNIVCSPYWLPAAPFTELVPLSEDRRGVYMSRFADRTHRGGWLLIQKNMPPALAWASPHIASLIRQVEMTHVPGRSLQNDDWTLQWFESRASTSPEATLSRQNATNPSPR